MRTIRLAAQFLFYSWILAILISNSVSAGISHDENQFIAPGQLLAYQGLLPYVDYPYTHMPYAAAVYAVSALASTYDFLAGRWLSCVAWLGCILLMLAVIRRLRAEIRPDTAESTGWVDLFWEFVLVYVFVSHGPMQLLLRTALNHSLATFFSLLAAWIAIRGFLSPDRAPRLAFASGALVMAAGLTRFNFAGLAVVLLICWMLFAWRLRIATAARVLWGYLAGALLASLPAALLGAMAPRAFYYGNLVYIRLNTVYYDLLLRDAGMDLAAKLNAFITLLASDPLEALLYAGLLGSAALSGVQVWKSRSRYALGHLCITGMAGAVWLSALAPTPTLLHYFAGAVPFLIMLYGTLDVGLGNMQKPARYAAGAALLLCAAVSIRMPDPIRQLTVLAEPELWPPVQVHNLGQRLHEFAAMGRILTLQPMIALEAGYEVYPFTATGPFSWRTSLLLTGQRRMEYGVTSPEELPELLDASPPAGILVGFEAPNAGFDRQDMGGLETPFSDYAMRNGYEAVGLTPPFWARGLTLWVAPR
jgi:hypothetical protein